MSEDKSRPRFELVVRIVRDNPEKTEEEPKFRDVLFESAAPVLAEFNMQIPTHLTPEQLLGMTNTDHLRNMAGPIIDQMQKVPVDMLVIQCIQGLQDKRARASVEKRAGVTRKLPEE